VRGPQIKGKQNRPLGNPAARGKWGGLQTGAEVHFDITDGEATLREGAYGKKYWLEKLGSTWARHRVFLNLSRRRVGQEREKFTRGKKAALWGRNPAGGKDNYERYSNSTWTDPHR